MKRSIKIFLIVITILFLLFVVSSIIGYQYLAHSPRYTEKGKIWGMALSALIFEKNGHSHLTLTGYEGDSIDPKMLEQHILKKFWKVDNKKDLFKSLNYMLSDGHTKTFFKLKRIIVTEQGRGDISIRNKYQLSDNHYKRLMYIRNYWNLYENTKFIAWDWGRYVSLCRWGYGAEYITEKQAWKSIMFMAQLVRSYYSSWDEYSSDYVLGRSLFGAGVGSELKYRYESIQISKKLLAEDGLWNTLDWNTPLYTENYMLLQKIDLFFSTLKSKLISLTSDDYDSSEIVEI